MSAPVEMTTRYATTVADLAAAWAFVMEYVDKVGDSPTIEIKPHWVISVHDMDRDDPEDGWPREFGVVVSGMVEEADS